MTINPFDLTPDELFSNERAIASDNGHGDCYLAEDELYLE